MAKWLEQASQWHEMYCHDLEVMSSNPGLVELGVHSTSVLSRTLTKYIIFVILYTRIQACSCCCYVVRVAYLMPEYSLLTIAAKLFMFLHKAKSPAEQWAEFMYVLITQKCCHESNTYHGTMNESHYNQIWKSHKSHIILNLLEFMCGLDFLLCGWRSGDK